MFYGNSPQDTRPLFYLSWQKYKRKQSLTPLEQQLVTVIADHPEYHRLLEHSKPTLSLDTHQENPFLHMGLHLAIRDQVSLNRPEGITAIYQTLHQHFQDPHHVEHLMMEPLARVLFEASQNNQPPDDAAYFKACKELIAS